MAFSAHLWPAGGIIATLASPFGPAMGSRLIRWARHKRLVGALVRWFFPEDAGPHPRRDVEPQVSLDAASLAGIRGALRDALQEGLRTAGRDPERTEELRRQNRLLQTLVSDAQHQTVLMQQLVQGVGEMLDEVRALRADTYTVTSTITRPPR